MDGTDVRVAVDTLSLRPPPPLSPPSRLPPVPSPPMGLLGSRRDERVGDLCISISKIIYRGTHHIYTYMYMHIVNACTCTCIYNYSTLQCMCTHCYKNSECFSFASYPINLGGIPLVAAQAYIPTSVHQAHNIHVLYMWCPYLKGGECG